MAVKPTDCTIRLHGELIDMPDGYNRQVVWPKYWERFLGHVQNRVKTEFDAAKAEYYRKNPRAPRWQNPISYKDIYERVQREEHEKYRVRKFNDRKGRTWLKFETHGDLSYFMMMWS